MHTCYGDIFSDAVGTISSNPQVLATGINCTHPQLVLVSFSYQLDIQKVFERVGASTESIIHYLKLHDGLSPSTLKIVLYIVVPL